MRNICLSGMIVVLLGGCAAGPTDFTRDYHKALVERPGVALGDRQSAERAVARFAAIRLGQDGRFGVEVRAVTGS